MAGIAAVAEKMELTPALISQKQPQGAGGPGVT